MRQCAWFAALTVSLAGSGAEAIVRELYSTNAVCKQQYCVNPVFPSLAQLPEMERGRWQKRTLSNVSQFMEFCGGLIDYDVALPLLNVTNATVQVVAPPGGGPAVLRAFDPVHEAAKQQDRLAAKQYFYHLAGMGIEAWDHTEPAQVSHHPLRPCARSVARLACYTHFPKALPSLRDGMEVSYLRPCRSSCESYVQECGVECCDESVRCAWSSEDGGEERRIQVAGGQEVLLRTGYVDAAGPSTTCTGA
mmetsp:Transcript_19590/g.51956  ORF Transcript_19590/g.51956 Transcript_19590/m.51956 type:complete len:249 (+) Transcript_19590:92-838(+)